MTLELDRIAEARRILKGESEPPPEFNANLTDAEARILEALKTTPPFWGMSKQIASNLDMKPQWVNFILERLIKIGRVEKLRRGVYRVKLLVNR